MFISKTKFKHQILWSLDEKQTHGTANNPNIHLLVASYQAGTQGPKKTNKDKIATKDMGIL